MTISRAFSSLRKCSSRVLMALALGALAPAAWAATASVAFAPTSFVPQGSSALTLTVLNDNPASITLSASAPLSLPGGSGLSFTGATSVTNCGALTAVASGTTLTFSSPGTVPGQGQCVITATVTGSQQGSYTLSLPSGFFTTSDGTNPPNGAADAGVTVTPPASVGIVLYTTIGNTTIGSAIYNSLYSGSSADFASIDGMTRLRWVFTNNNPYALNITSFAFPTLLGHINVIPDDLVAPNGLFSLDTTGDQPGRSGVYVAGSVGCGGALTITNAYSLTTTTFAPGVTGDGSSTLGSISTPVTPLTLTGATIPANGACEVSFLARYDGGGMGISNGVPYIAGGNSNTVAVGVSAGAVVTDRGVSNNAQSFPVTTLYTALQMIGFVDGAATSGYAGSATTINVQMNNQGQVMPVTPSTAVNPGILYSVAVGIEPQLPVASTTTGCPGLPASAWDSVNRRIAFAGPFPARTNCGYNIPFVASYAGSGGTHDPAYTDAQVCAMTAGPDGIAGTADDAYVVTPGGLTYKLLPFGNDCVTYRAAAGSVPANAVTIAAQLQDYAGNDVNPGGTVHAGGDYTMQLTLSAPAGSGGVTDYQLAATYYSSIGSIGFANLDPTQLSYVPAISNTCGGALTATPGQSSLSITGVNLADGASCVIRLPLGNVSFGYNSTFNIPICGASGTVNGATVCSPGVNLSYPPSNDYLYDAQSLQPVIVAQSELSAGLASTALTFTLNKNAGHAPIENAGYDFNLAATSASTVDYGLQAIQILSNTCHATVNGISGGAGTALPNLSMLNFTNISTPDSQAQGQVAYHAAGGYDVNAFQAASGCSISVKVVPTTNLTSAGTHITTANTMTQVDSNNGGVTQGNATGVLTAPTFSVLAITPTPPTIGMGFNPGSIPAGAVSQLTISIDNSQGTPVDLTNVVLTHDYPPGLLNNASPANAAMSAGCVGGTVNAANGGASLALSGLYIPAGQVCTVTVNVVTISAQTVNDSIAANALSSDQGVSSNAATASLVLAASIGAVLQFSPSSFNYDPNAPANNHSLLKFSFVNSFGAGATASNVSVSNFSLPAGMTIAGPAQLVGSGCTLTASGDSVGSTSIGISGGAVPGASTCEIDFPVTLSAAPTTTPTQDYTVTIPANTITAAVVGNGTQTDPTQSATTLTVAPPATVSISKALAALPTDTPTNGAGIPQSGYPVTLTCTNSGTFNLSIGTASATTQPVQANDTCTVSEGAPPSLGAGYSWGTGAQAPTYVPASGSVSTTAGATVSATVTNTVIASTTTVNVSSVFNPGTVGGTPPTPALTCTPSATASGLAYTVTTGAQCTLTVSGGTVPGGYTAGTTSYSGTGIAIDASAGTFTVPAAGGSVTATTALTVNPSQTVAVSNVFNPAITGGTLPTITLTCTPAASGLTAPTGASCTLGTTGGTAPNGYTLGSTTFTGTGVTAGAFTMPAGGLSITASTALTAQSQTLTVTSNVFNPAIAGGTLPTVTLTCTPAGSGLTAPTGASCTLGTTGGTAPNGYTLGSTTFTGTGVTGGAFTMPAGGISVTASTSLTAQSQTLTVSSNLFSPNVTGGTLPTVTLTCTPAGTGLTAPTGASCTLGTSNAVAPNGYALGTTTFTGTGVTGGAFTMPAGGLSITASTALTAQSQTLTVTSNVFNPAIAGGTAPTVTLTCTPTATGLTAPTGASCTLGTSGAVAPNGYALGATTFTGTGVTAGAFTMPAGGLSITASTALTAQSQTLTVTSNVFNPAIAGGTAPTVTLTCTPTATGLTAPTGASCTLGTTGGAAPSGYALGSTTFTGTGVTGGAFTMPAGGISITASTALTAQSQILTVSSNVFNPAITGGTLPTVTLTCTPAGSGLTAPTGASCTLGTTGGAAPSGYTLGSTTFTGSGVTGGAFTMPAGGLSITASTALTAQSQTLTVSSNVFNPAITGGTLPTVTLTCTPAGTGLTAPTGASCTLGTSGAAAPNGYALGSTTFTGTGVTAGAFTMPVGGLSVTASTALTAQSQTLTVTSNVFNPAIAGGTVPTVTLTCTPAGSGLTAPTGASCTLGTSGAAAPNGYTLGSTTFTGTGVTAGAFTMPAGGLSVTASTALTAQSQTVTLSSNVFDPNVTDSVSVLPTITLTCNPAATGLSAPTGASCTINATNANAPNGYQLGTTAFTGSAITDTSTGAFVMPAGGFSLTVTTILNENAGQTITIPANGNTFSENGSTITGGTLPTVTLTCTPAATPVSGSTTSWTAPQGANCTLSVPATGTTGAAVAPDGYTLGSTTFGGITFTSGNTFSVPNGAVSLSVTTALTADEQPVSLATSGGNVFVPAVSGGTLPTITLTCNPAQTESTPGSAWTAPTGASCQFQASGAEPPPGYTLGATTFDDGSGSGGSSGSGDGGSSDSSRLGSVMPAMRSPKQASGVVDPNTGAFIVPAGGVPTVVVRTALLRLAPPVPVPLDGRWMVVLGGLLLAVGVGWRQRVKR